MLKCRCNQVLGEVPMLKMGALLFVQSSLHFSAVESTTSIFVVLTF